MSLRMSMLLAGAGAASGLMVGLPPARRAWAVRMAALDELAAMQGPAIVWGPEGVPLGYEETDIKAYEGFGRFVAACQQHRVYPPPGSTILVPADSAFDRAPVEVTADVLRYHIITGGAKELDKLVTDQPTLQGGTLTAYRKFRKNYLDSVSISPLPNWPANVRTRDGCMIHAVDSILVPGAYQNTGGYTSALAAPVMSAEPPFPTGAPEPTPPPVAEPPAAERGFGFTSASQNAAQSPIARAGQGSSGASVASRPVKPAAPVSASKKVAEPILVQGGSLRTWSYQSPLVEQVQLKLSTEGRPLDADIELWHGPDNTPVKMRVYVENGQLRPFTTVLETPRGPNTVAIRNIGQLEFPFAANVISEDLNQPSPNCLASFMTIQGGALRTFPFDSSVNSVQVLIKTDGRPLNSRIELLQGPNNNKQVIELYTEDGLNRPFFCFLETPGSGNVVRVVNTAPVEFPMAAAVVPHLINTEMTSDAVLGGDVVIGGDIGW